MEKENDDITIEKKKILAGLSTGAARWIPGVSGGLAGAIVTILFIVIPVVNTWLANTKEISLAQIKNTAEQIEYVTSRMRDSDKERDLYKAEMLRAQQELRECKNKK
jgi:hypothetical protein